MSIIKRGGVFLFLVFLPGGGERLAHFAAVAIERDRLEAQLPAIDIDVADIIHRGLVGQVDGLADRPRNEGLRGRHDPDVAHRGDEADALFAATVGAVEDRIMFRAQVRRPFSRPQIWSLASSIWASLKPSVRRMLKPGSAACSAVTPSFSSISGPIAQGEKTPPRSMAPLSVPSRRVRSSSLKPCPLSVRSLICGAPRKVIVPLMN